MEDFTPRKKTTYASLPFIMRPAHDECFIAFASPHDSFEAFIHKNVRDIISQEAYKAAPNETIGLLGGRVLRDARGPYTLVLAAQGALRDEIDATPSHVRISATGHARVRSRLESSAYGLDIIGWYHSHPRYPPRFSSVDMTEQSTWRDPNHLGIVISGIDAREPLGVYRGPQALLLISTTKTAKIIPALETIQANTIPLGGAVEEVRGDTVTGPETGTSVSAAPLPRVISERLHRVFNWTLAFGLMVMTFILIWFSQRLFKVEQRLASALLDKERAEATAPQITPTPVSSALGPEDTADKSNADKLLSADHPVTRAHPLLPNPATVARERAKAKMSLKKSAKERLGQKPAPRNPATSEAGASPQTKAVKRGNASDNRSKPKTEAAPDKSVKP